MNFGISWAFFLLVYYQFFFPWTHKFTPNLKELKCVQCLKNLGYEVRKTVINFHVYGS